MGKTSKGQESTEKILINDDQKEKEKGTYKSSTFKLLKDILEMVNSVLKDASGQSLIRKAKMKEMENHTKALNA